MASALLQENITQTLTELSKKSLTRELICLDGAQGPEILLEGRTYLNFCSNNYLGLADDNRLKEAAIEEMRQSGWGSGASRLVCGNMQAHMRLERKMAEFKKTESCLVFSTGYMANIGIISSLFGRDDVIFSDKLNHASIVDGIILSQAKFKRYAHNDMEVLERMLQQVQVRGQKVIITDSVFSMDGDIASLKEIVALAKKYQCLVMIDEAHALGVFGKKGKGLVEYLGVENDIDIQMGTFSKAVGSFGAYCCGSSSLIDLLKNKARSFIYTTGMPPAVVAASLKGIEIIEHDSRLREHLWAKTKYVRDAIKAMGLDTMNSRSPIIPVLVKDSKKALSLSEALKEEGIFVSAIRPPTVPTNTARLRCTVMANHTQAQLDVFLEKLKNKAGELCLI